MSRRGACSGSRPPHPYAASSHGWPPRSPRPSLLPGRLPVLPARLLRQTSLADPEAEGLDGIQGRGAPRSWSSNRGAAPVKTERPSRERNPAEGRQVHMRQGRGTGAPPALVFSRGHPPPLVHPARETTDGVGAFTPIIPGMSRAAPPRSASGRVRPFGLWVTARQGSNARLWSTMREGSARNPLLPGMGMPSS